jgi:hypothetical protein
VTLPAKFIYAGIHVADHEKPIKPINFHRETLGMRLLFKAKIKETGGRVAWLMSNGSKQVLELVKLSHNSFLGWASQRDAQKA